MPKNIKIYLLTSEDPLFSLNMVKALCEKYEKNIVGACFASGLFNAKRVYLGPLLYGPFNFVKIVTRVLLSSFTGGKIESYLKSRGIIVDHVADVNAEQTMKRIRDLNVNLLVSINCNQKIKEPLFSFPKYKTINIHNGKLPAYGGLMPIFHAYARGEEEIGVTIHYIDKNLDSGAIIRQDLIPINKGDTYFSLWEKSVDVGTTALLEVIDNIFDEKTQPRLNDPKGRSYYSFPKIPIIFKYYKRYFKTRF